MLQVEAGEPFVAMVEGGTAGLAGQLTVEIYNPADASVVVAATTAGITEPRPATYLKTFTVDHVTAEGDPPLRIRWVEPPDADPDDADSTEEDLFVHAGVWPTADEVAAILRARTKAEFGAGDGTFNEATRPTATQVVQFILQAQRKVLSALDQDPLIDKFHDSARDLMALRAAMFVELSYRPEQANPDSSAYRLLKELYDEDLVELHERIRDTADETVDSAVGMPIGTFPGSDVEVTRVGWGTWF